MRFLSLFLLPLLLILPHAAHAEKITVVASFSILGDMVHEVAGDKVNLITLVGPNSDAHAYEPTPADAKTVAGANLLIVNGFGFETWQDRLVQASGFKGTIATASEGITPILNKDTPDPHAWQDIKNGKLYAINISAALAKADPANAGIYAANAAHYVKTLTAIDEWVKAAIAKVPQAKRRAITSHDALQYFSRAYGVSFIAPMGLNTSGEVSAYYMAQLIDLIKRKEVRAVFMENMTDPRLVKQLVSDGGAVLGGTLYSDALSEPTGPAPTYVEMFRHNVTTLAEAMIQN